MGFVLGPMTMTVLHRLLKVSTADTFYAAAVFPLVGLFYAMFRMSETKVGDTGVSKLWQRRSGSRGASAAALEMEHRAQERRERALASRQRRRRRTHAVQEGEPQGYGGDAYVEGDQANLDEGDVAFVAGEDDGWIGEGEAAAAVTTTNEVDRSVAAEVIPRAVMLLVGNGFLLMYAFSIETIYAMFLKV